MCEHWCPDRNSRNNNKHVNTETTPPSQATFRSLPPLHLRRCVALPSAQRIPRDKGIWMPRRENARRPPAMGTVTTETPVVKTHRMPCAQSNCIIRNRNESSNEDVQSLNMCKQSDDFLVRVIKYCALSGVC